MGYPKVKYHKDFEPKTVESEDAENKLGSDWADSPADHGVITAPSVEQKFEMDKEEAKKNKELADSVEDAVEKKRAGRPKKNTEEE